MELSKLRLILGCCWCIGQMWGIHSHNINLQADQSQCVTPEKTDGSEEQWDISAPDDTYLRLNCIIRGSGSCDQSSILISQGNRSTTICPTGSQSRHFRENRNYNTAQITILNGIPEVTAFCQATAVSTDGQVQIQSASQDPDQCAA
ncbi:triatox-like [Rhodnius prolixus]|uniref:Uncharacterized protein n=1 Tax=Rhodnius prolixus TaxID=13249 RepID=T1HQX5_RHOPR